ncbi:MAG: hypothetical protein JXR50_06365 [Prolixibacteraceae bacterium]|nr:hypothetical protein [Prolixibacteraceae bacterium]
MDAERLRKAIDASDYRSHAEFARDIGYTTVSLSNVLAGKTDPRSELVKVMVINLRKKNSFVDADWLLGIKDENEEDELVQRFNEMSLKLEKYQTLESAVKLSSNRNSPRESSSGCYSQKLEFAS